MPFLEAQRALNVEAGWLRGLACWTQTVPEGTAELRELWPLPLAEDLSHHMCSPSGGNTRDFQVMDLINERYEPMRWTEEEVKAMPAGIQPAEVTAPVRNPWFPGALGVGDMSVGGKYCHIAISKMDTRTPSLWIRPFELIGFSSTGLNNEWGFFDRWAGAASWRPTFTADLRLIRSGAEVSVPLDSLGVVPVNMDSFELSNGATLPLESAGELCPT